MAFAGSNDGSPTPQADSLFPLDWAPLPSFVSEDHGLIGHSWTRPKPPPIKEELARNLPGQDGSSPVRAPAQKLAEGLEGGLS